MNINFEYRPLPIHEPFHRSTAPQRLVVGGFGSGKSYALCAEAIAFMLEYPGVEVLVTRKTIPALKDSTEKIFASLLPPDFEAQCDIRRAGGHLESITFPNGSVAYFRGMDDPEKHRSMTLAMIAYDELSQFAEDDYTQMLGRVRQTEPTKMAKKLGAKRIPINKIIAATNPSGKDWVYKWFVDPDTRQRDAEYFLSTSLDNPFNPTEYVRRLLAMPEQYVRRYVLATFDDFEGSIYPDWSYETHVIKRFNEFPHGAQFMQLMDPGTHNPTAALWTYYDAKQHRLVGIAEYKEPGLASSRHAAAWRAIEARHRMKVTRRIADPQAINVRDRGTNTALSDQYRRLGFSFELGPSRLDDRIPALGQLIVLRRFVVTEDCPMTAEALQNYHWADLTPSQIANGAEAKPNKKDMDLVDCCQYAASRYIAPPKIQPGQRPEATVDAEIKAAIRKQLARQRAQAGRNHDLGGISV